jgi:hypothetical protein
MTYVASVLDAALAAEMRQARPARGHGAYGARATPVAHAQRANELPRRFLAAAEAIIL